MHARSLTSPKLQKQKYYTDVGYNFYIWTLLIMSLIDQAELVQYDYSEIYSPDNLMKYYLKNDSDFRKWDKSWVKNIVMNHLYSSDELSITEKFIFAKIYDFKAQQKHLPGIEMTQKHIAICLGLDISTVSRALTRLEQMGLLFTWYNQFGNKVLIPNENVTTWWVSIDAHRLSCCELLRKQCASLNKQWDDEFKRYKKTQK